MNSQTPIRSTDPAPAPDAEITLRLQEWIVNANPRAIAIDLDTDLIGQGAIDSLQMVNFLLFIEEIRGEEIPEALIRPEYFSTVRIIHDKFFDNKARQGGRHAG